MGQRQQIRQIMKKAQDERDKTANEKMAEGKGFPKMAKRLVRYRNASPEDVDNEMICGSCRFFERDTQYCHLVEGEINAEDICDFWAPTESRVEQSQ